AVASVVPGDELEERPLGRRRAKQVPYPPADGETRAASGVRERYEVKLAADHAVVERERAPDGYVAVRGPGGRRTGAPGQRGSGGPAADSPAHRRRACWFRAVPHGQGQPDVGQHVLGGLAAERAHGGQGPS